MDEIQALAKMYESRDGQADDSKTLVNVVVQISRDPLDCLAHSMTLQNNEEETIYLSLRHTRFVIMDNNTLAFTRPTIPEMVVSSDEDDDNFQGPVYLYQTDARQRAVERSKLPINHQVLEAEASFKMSYLRFGNQAQCTAMCNAITAASANASSQVTIMHLGDDDTPEGLIDISREYQIHIQERDRIAEEILADRDAEISWRLIRTLEDTVRAAVDDFLSWHLNEGESASTKFLSWCNEKRNLLWRVSRGEASKDNIPSRDELVQQFRDGINQIIAVLTQRNL